MGDWVWAFSNREQSVKVCVGAQTWDNTKYSPNAQYLTSVRTYRITNIVLHNRMTSFNKGSDRIIFADVLEEKRGWRWGLVKGRWSRKLSEWKDSPSEAWMGRNQPAWEAGRQKEQQRQRTQNHKHSGYVGESERLQVCWWENAQII